VAGLHPGLGERLVVDELQILEAIQHLLDQVLVESLASQSVRELAAGPGTCRELAKDDRSGDLLGSY